MHKVMFIVSVCIVGFLYGFAASELRLFPYFQIRDAVKTGSALMKPSSETGLVDFLRFESNGDPTKRWRDAQNGAMPKDSVLVFGGRDRFLDDCPEFGCIAVVLNREGKVVRSYPYLPHEIFDANSVSGFDYQGLGFDPATDMRPLGIEMYPDGDLLVAFQHTIGVSMFPFGAGVARIAPDGKPRWFRRDYSHHWPSLFDGDRAFVASMTIGSGPLEFKLADSRIIRIRCNSERPYLDTVQELDPNGKQVSELALVDTMMNSPFRAVLQHTTDKCDPLHLNYIDQFRGPKDALPDGINPGDLILSLRNISSVAILDKETRKFKRLIRGTFFQQHSVSHLDGGKLLIFDNHGGNVDGGPSRVIELDLNTGAERLIFPTTNLQLEMSDTFSDTAGYLDISPDRQRVLIAVSNAGKAYEVRISDGALLGVYTDWHQLSGNKTGLFRLLGINYLRYELTSGDGK